MSRLEIIQDLELTFNMCVQGYTNDELVELYKDLFNEDVAVKE